MKAKNREQETEYMPLYYLHDDRKKKKKKNRTIYIKVGWYIYIDRYRDQT